MTLPLERQLKAESLWYKDTGFPQTKASARVFYWLNLIRSQFANSLQGSAPGNTKQSRESGSRKVREFESKYANAHSKEE